MRGWRVVNVPTCVIGYEHVVAGVCGMFCVCDKLCSAHVHGVL